MKVVKVESADAGKRLDLLLKFELPEYSRANIRKLLDDGKVLLNKEVEYRPNYKVREGDVFEISEEASLQRERLKPYAFKLDVIYEDDDLVIINKPSGLKVHPTSSGEFQTLINAVYHHYEAVSLDGSASYGFTLINRIDQATSGLVLVAKSARGAWHFAQEFAQSKVEKFYVAIVEGKWEQNAEESWTDIRDKLQYDSQKRIQSVSPHRGEFAHTRVKLIAYDRQTQTSLLLLQPITGRTHQLRVQLASRGYPIVGDKRYVGLQSTRLLLHAYHLRIHGVDGKLISATAEIPAEFRYLAKDVKDFANLQKHQ